MPAPRPSPMGGHLERRFQAGDHLGVSAPLAAPLGRHAPTGRSASTSRVGTCHVAQGDGRAGGEEHQFQPKSELVDFTQCTFLLRNSTELPAHSLLASKCMLPTAKSRSSRPYTFADSTGGADDGTVKGSGLWSHLGETGAALYRVTGAQGGGRPLPPLIAGKPAPTMVDVLPTNVMHNHINLWERLASERADAVTTNPAEIACAPVTR